MNLARAPACTSHFAFFPSILDASRERVLARELLLASLVKQMPARTKKAQEQVGTSAAGGAGSKAAAMSGASTVMDTAAHPDLVLPLCQLSLPEYGRPRALQWNAHGQALVVTETVCYILTPSMGYHPLLKPNQPSFVEADSLLDVADGIASSKSASANTPAGAPDFTGKPKPMDFFGSGIDLPSFQAVKASKTHDRAVDSQGASAAVAYPLHCVLSDVLTPPRIGRLRCCQSGRTRYDIQRSHLVSTWSGHIRLVPPRCCGYKL